jgi:uncharacterized protein YceH (UPF0502 family)
MKREPPLVKVLPRQPGTKEARYAHLMSGDVVAWAQEPAVVTPTVSSNSSPNDDRIASLENQVADLEKEISDLKQQFSAFRKQFE